MGTHPIFESDFDCLTEMSQPLDEDTTKGLLIWIDGIELSRPKKNINRDFADGVLVAELIAHFFPHRVEKHNYQAASSRQGKLTNWATLNRKVLAKFGFTVPADVVESIIAAKPNVVEVFLNGLKQIIDRELNAELEQYYEPHQYMEPTPKTKPKKHQMPKARPAQAPKEDLMSTIQAGIPLKNLNLRGIDTDTR